MTAPTLAFRAPSRWEVARNGAIQLAVFGLVVKATLWPSEMSTNLLLCWAAAQTVIAVLFSCGASFVVEHPPAKALPRRSRVLRFIAHLTTPIEMALLAAFGWFWCFAWWGLGWLLMEIGHGALAKAEARADA